MRMRLAGQCIRHNEEVTNRLVLCYPTEGRPVRGIKRVHYVDNLPQVAGLVNVEELKKIMKDRVE